MDHKSGLNVRSTLLQILVLFIVVATVYTGIAYIIQNNLNRVKQQEIINTETRSVLMKQELIDNRLEDIIDDLFYVRDLFVKEVIAGESYAYIADEFLSFSDGMKLYDQMRFIDTAGMEQIRVNYDTAGAYIVSAEALQDKSAYYYFKSAIQLADGEIYFSNIDLNIENGVIEEPYKPILRVATPVYINNELLGIIILNYYESDIGQLIATSLGNSDEVTYMLDSTGYWLIDSDDPDKQWGSQLTERQDLSFAAEYPEEWAVISTSGTGTFVTADGVFSYVRLFSDDDKILVTEDRLINYEKGDYYLITYLPNTSGSWSYFQDGFTDTIAYVISANAGIYLMILAIAVTGGIFYSFYRQEKARIRYLSEYDAMTSVLNRRAGLERLSRLNRKASTVSVCFIDINGLKEVNDRLGHQAGDELIKTAVEVMRHEVRKTDFIARLGGDEFLIVMDGSTRDNAEAIWERIKAAYDLININEERLYNISLSHGVVELADEDIDTYIKKADDMMYKEKKILKKTVKIIKEPVEDTGA